MTIQNDEGTGRRPTFFSGGAAKTGQTKQRQVQKEPGQACANENKEVRLLQRFGQSMGSFVQLDGTHDGSAGSIAYGNIDFDDVAIRFFKMCVLLFLSGPGLEIIGIVNDQFPFKGIIELRIGVELAPQYVAVA